MLSPCQAASARPLPMAALVLLVAAAAAAQDAGDLRRRALTLASEGRCPAALPLLRQVAEPPTAEVSTALAMCEILAGRSADALAAVGQARAQGIEGPELSLQEGIALFHLGDAAAAEAPLERAAAGGAHRAETLLYQGLVALSLGRPAEAVAALDEARRLDPGHVEPVASYYAAVARRTLGEDRDAREGLRDVRDTWPDTAWSLEAEKALAGGGGPVGPWLEVTLGGAYDDNVVLAGTGVRLPEELPGQRDTLFAWNVQAGSTLWQDGPWALGGLAQVGGTIHDDLHDFDVTQPSVLLWLDRALDSRTLLRAELASSYAWVDSDPFRLSYAAALVGHRVWDERHASTLRLAFHRDDTKFADDDVPDGPGRVGAPCLDPSDLVCSPPGIDESRARNRDGNGAWLALVHQMAFGERHLAWGGLRFRRFSARGSEYSFDAQSLELGVRFGLPARFDLELSGIVARRHYRNPTTFPQPDEVFAGVQYGLDCCDRRETSLRTRLVLGHDFTGPLPAGSPLAARAQSFHGRRLRLPPRRVRGVRGLRAGKPPAREFLRRTLMRPMLTLVSLLALTSARPPWRAPSPPRARVPLRTTKACASSPCRAAREAPAPEVPARREPGSRPEPQTRPSVPPRAQAARSQARDREPRAARRERACDWNTHPAVQDRVTGRWSRRDGDSAPPVARRVPWPGIGSATGTGCRAPAHRRRPGTPALRTHGGHGGRRRAPRSIPQAGAFARPGPCNSAGSVCVGLYPGPAPAAAPTRDPASAAPAQAAGARRSQPRRRLRPRPSLLLDPHPNETR